MRVSTYIRCLLIKASRKRGCRLCRCLGSPGPQGRHNRSECCNEAGPALIQLAQDGCSSKVTSQRRRPRQTVPLSLKGPLTPSGHKAGFFLTLPLCWHVCAHGVQRPYEENMSGVLGEHRVGPCGWVGVRPSKWSGHGWRARSWGGSVCRS